MNTLTPFTAGLLSGGAIVAIVVIITVIVQFIRWTHRYD